MEQPSWPFEYDLSHVWSPDPAVCDGFANAANGWGECPKCGRVLEDHDREGFVPAGANAAVVYLVEGSQLAYGTKDAWNS